MPPRYTHQELELGRELLRQAREYGVDVHLEHDHLRDYDRLVAEGAEPLVRAIRENAGVVWEAMVEHPNPHPEWGMGGGDHDRPYVFGRKLSVVDPDPLSAAEWIRLHNVKAKFLHRTSLDRCDPPAPEPHEPIEPWMAQD